MAGGTGWAHCARTLGCLGRGRDHVEAGLPAPWTGPAQSRLPQAPTQQVIAKRPVGVNSIPSSETQGGGGPYPHGTF